MARAARPTRCAAGIAAGSGSSLLIARPGLIETVERQAAQELGVEVGGLLRQDFARQGHLGHLLDAYRIEQKADLSAAVVDCGDGSFHFALVGDVAFRGHRRRSDPQPFFEQQAME